MDMKVDRTRFIINLFGNMTTGKSTVAVLLQNSIPGLCTVDYDVIKRQIAGYDANRECYRETAANLTRSFLHTVVNDTQLPVLVLLPVNANYDSFSETWGSVNDPVLHVLLFAPDEVLHNRFDERVRKLVEKGTPEEEIPKSEHFRNQLSRSYYRPDGTVLYDTSQLSPDFIAGNILEQVRTG